MMVMLQALLLESIARFARSETAFEIFPKIKDKICQT